LKVEKEMNERKNEIREMGNAGEIVAVLLII